LEERFYTVANSIVHDISSEQNEKVFVKKSLIMRFVGWTISVLSAVFDFLILSFTSNFSSDFLDSIFNLEFGDTTDFVVAVCGMAISAIAFLFSFFIRQRTDDGHEVKQRINGFRIFLEKAEKERLEMLVEENPTYFYDMLPYAYVLGVSDKWVKNFEGIAIEPPTWYFGYGSTFDRIVFYHFINRTMSSAERAMISTPQNNSSGGGFSGGFGGGGGFSGGGVGGGGGGSW
jgi:uncharacterized membrane protein